MNTKSKLISIFIVLTMIVSIISTNMYSAFAQNEQNLADYVDRNLPSDVTDRSQIKIGDTILKPGDNKIPYGSNIDIKLVWGFIDSEFPTKDNYTMVYTLPEGISIEDCYGKELKDGTETVGHFDVSGRTITIRYDAGELSEQFFNKSNRHGSLILSGTLNGSFTNDHEGGDSTIDLPGVGSFIIHMDRDTSNDKVEVEKIGGKVTGNTNDLSAEFKLKVSATGPQTNIIVTDTMDENMKLDGNVEFYTDEACTIPYTGSVTNNVKEDNKFQYTIGSMNDKQVLYAKYKVKVNKNIFLSNPYDWDSKAGNSVTVKSDKQENEKYASKKLEYTKKNWAEKTHSVTGEGGNKVINWEITLNPGGSFDIGGSIIKDTLGDKIGEYIGGSFKCSPSIEGLTWESLKSGNFKLPDGCDKEYKITYQTKYGEESDGPIIKKDNTFTINPFGNTKDIEYKDSFDEGDKDFKYIEKSFTKREGSKLEWKIKINVPKGGINNLIVKDTPYDMSIDSFEVVSGYYGTPTLNQEKNTLTFGRVEEGTIILKVITDIGSVPSITKTYTNKSECYDGTDKLGESSASYQYEVKNYLKKSADWSDCNKDEMYWNLSIDPIQENYQNVYITDNLPENTQYVEGSLEAYTLGQWGNEEKNEEIVSDIQVEKESGTVKFTFTQDALDYIKTKKIRLRYRIKIIDITKAFNDKEYTNTATLILDDKTMSASDSRWFKISKDTVLKKEYTYNRDTAPNVKYTITVNETASKLNNGNDITLKDEMGSALDYYMNSLTINGIKATSQQVNYDEHTHILTIKIPDEKKVVLKYEATVNLPVGGDSNALNESNAFNKCSLKGTPNQAKLDTQVSLKGKVFESSGSSTGNGVSVKLYKYEKGDQTKTLKDAEFVCSEVSYDDHLNTTEEVVKSRGTTLSNGYLNFYGLQRNKLYKIVETKAPDNYKLDATPKYFIFKGNNKTYPDTITNGGITYPVTCIDESQAIYTCMFENEKGSTPKANVEIIKVDDSSEKLVGAKLQVLDETGNQVDIWTTDGTTRLLRLLPGTYTLHEIKAPEGYLTAEDIIFVVGNDGKIVGYDQNKITMEDKKIGKGKLILTKTIEGNISKEEAKNITFKVTNQQTNKSDTYTLDKFDYDETNKKWTKELEVLEGTYTVEETNSSILGYTVTTVYTVGNKEENGSKAENVQVEDQGETTIAFTNSYTPKEYEVAISKQDLTSGKEIAGATLKIVKQGTTDVVNSWTTSKEEKTHSISLPFGEYTLIEEGVPDGYKKADDIDFKITKSGEVLVKNKNGTYSETNEIVMQDEPLPGKLVISKSITGSITKEQAKNSIKFKVINNKTKEENTYLLENFNYNENTKTWTKELTQVAGGYTVEELVTSIKGHKLSLTQYQINEDGTIKKVTDKKAENVIVKKGKTTSIEFKNNYDLDVYDVEIEKTDISGTKEVAGAELKVIDANGIVETWTSGQNGEKTHKLKLVPGKYTLIEESAPYGYRKAQNIEFIVDENGKIVGTNSNKVIMKDENTQGKLILTKTIEGNISKEEAKNITFKVTNQQTNKSDTYTLDKFDYDETNKKWTKELDVLAGQYAVEETNSSISGYTVTTVYTVGNKEENGSKAENVQVEDQGETTIAFTNSYTLKKYDVTISKQDLISGDNIVGASLQIKNKDTNEITNIVSTNQDQTVQLAFGNYILTEITAPDGYKIAPSIEFTVSKDGKVRVDGNEVEKIIMKDQPIGKLMITKTVKGDLTKEQAEKSIKFEVTNNDSKDKKEYALSDFTYDGNSWKLELEENTGGYTVKEVVSDVEGYTLKETTYTVGNDTESGKKVNVDIEKGETTTVTFENTYERTRYEVNIDKVDDSNEKLVGAKLQVLDETGNQVDIWTTDGTTHSLSLLPGTYTLHEVEAPEGYLTAEDIKFVVGNDGKIVDHNDNTIVMKDQEKPGKLMITKTVKGDLTKEQAESSIKFEVTNNDTKDKKEYPLSDFTYDGNSWKLELEENTGGYTVKEVVSDVDGYTLKETTYTVGNDTESGKKVSVDIEKGKITTVTYENTYEKVDIPSKEDDTPNNENKDSSNNQPQVVSNDSKKNSSQKNNKQSTKTGDESALLENMALMIVSLFGVLKGCKVYYKRKEC